MKLSIRKSSIGVVFVMLFCANVANAAPATDHYAIVHRSFRDVVLSGNRIELAKLTEQGDVYVRDFWSRHRNANETIEQQEISAISTALFSIDDRQVVVIQWPTPTVSPEAYMSAVVLSHSAAPAYYCLEKMDDSNPLAKLLGDAVLGRWTAETHQFVGIVGLPDNKSGMIEILKSNGL